MVINYCSTFSRTPKSRVTIHPYPRWGIIITLRIWSFKVRADAQLLACFVLGALLFLWMDLPDMVFGQSSVEVGVGNEARSKESSSVLKNLLRETTIHCGNWKLALSKSKIFFLERLVPIFTGQILGMSGLDYTHFCFVPLTQRSLSSLQKKNFITSSLFLWAFCIMPIYVGAAVVSYPKQS